jgi:hypothetical protein
MAQHRMPHGVPGQINGYTLDRDSVITGYGKHYRVLGVHPSGDTLEIRVDHTGGPRMPTVAEVLAVARKDQYLRGEWSYQHTTETVSSDGRYPDATWFVFTKNSASVAMLTIR